VAPIVRLWHQQDEVATPPAPLQFDDGMWPQPYLWSMPVRPIACWWVQQEEIGPYVPPVFTHDSPQRIGGTTLRDTIERIGSRIARDTAERIGPKKIG